MCGFRRAFVGCSSLFRSMELIRFISAMRACRFGCALGLMTRIRPLKSQHLRDFPAAKPPTRLQVPSISKPKQKAPINGCLLLWCGRWDLNPYGLPYAPQTYASADSATTAKRRRSRDKNNYTGFTAACQHKKENLFLCCGLRATLKKTPIFP